MSDSQQSPWSDSPNAPKIPHASFERVWFAGKFVSSILYSAYKKSPPIQLLACAHFVCLVILGIVIVLFSKCMTALFNPDHRRGPIKWGLVSYTLAVFTLVTVGTAMQIDVQSVSYIDNHQKSLVPEGVFLLDRPGTKKSLPPRQSLLFRMLCSS